MRKEIIMTNDIAARVQACRDFFDTNATKPYAFRIAQLQKLKTALKENQQKLLNALYSDLHKTEMEGYFSELGIVYEELNFIMKHLKKWMKPKKVKTPIAQFPAKSSILYEPFGTVLIMSPWNYPINLTLAPLVGAIAAGNCSVVKPSNQTPATAAALKKLLSENFPEEYISVVEGGRKENTELLTQRFDYIFFTGGIQVGKTVMEAAAKHLTPITLELGGKSPCIVEKSANIKIAARRILFGKSLNAGQTCVAPDYLLIDESIKEAFIAEAKNVFKEFFPTETYLQMQLPRIVNDKHFERLSNLLHDGTLVVGGSTEANSRFIEPTIIENIDFDSPIMQEEIFGPILPVITYKDLNAAISQIKKRDKPLALYLFTEDKSIEKKILTELSFGGGCVNDTIVHLATNYLPFGGVGYSGMGKYHGEESFKIFSNAKSILKKSTLFDLKLRYHPYSESKYNTIKKFM